MKNLYTKEELINFEQEIAECFNKGMIKAPVHLYDGNEEQMIEIFKDVKEQDWIFCSWRSHYQCLLKGVPKEELKKAILDGRSITLCFKEQNIFSSAIVTGQIPLAVGVALDLKRKKIENQTVWVFVGDMTAETGTMHEAIKFSVNHDLPIKFIIEDNGKSVCTDTKNTWGYLEGQKTESMIYAERFPNKVIYYEYKLNKWPHAGSGSRIQF
jgi:pyruvate dehydrogenase E1 component alpha subunit